jgi:hypothetical protein
MTATVTQWALARANEMDQAAFKGLMAVKGYNISEMDVKPDKVGFTASVGDISVEVLIMDHDISAFTSLGTPFQEAIDDTMTCIVSATRLAEGVPVFNYVLFGSDVRAAMKRAGDMSARRLSITLDIHALQATACAKGDAPKTETLYKVARLFGLDLNAYKL